MAFGVLKVVYSIPLLHLQPSLHQQELTPRPPPPDPHRLPALRRSAVLRHRCLQPGPQLREGDAPAARPDGGRAAAQRRPVRGGGGGAGPHAPRGGGGGVPGRPGQARRRAGGPGPCRSGLSRPFGRDSGRTATKNRIHIIVSIYIIYHFCKCIIAVVPFIFKTSWWGMRRTIPSLSFSICILRPQMAFCASAYVFIILISFALSDGRLCNTAMWQEILFFFHEESEREEFEVLEANAETQIVSWQSNFQ